MKVLIIVFVSIISLLLTIFAIDIYISIYSQSKIYSQTASIPQKKVALVLGTARIYQNHINAFYITRIQAAAKLYLSGKVDIIIVSGDRKSIDYSEPDDMQKDLISLGVPESVILKDYHGFRTFDSISNIENDFGFTEYILISQKFHIERALYIAQAKGHKAIGFIAANPQNFVSYLKVRIREVLARVKMLFDLYLSQVP